MSMEIERLTSSAQFQSGVSGSASAPPKIELPAPALCDSMFDTGDLGDKIALLIMRSARENRESARESHVIAAKSLEQAERNEVRAMHEKADDVRFSGWSQAALQVGGGILDFASGMRGADALEANGVSKSGSIVGSPCSPNVETNLGARFEVLKSKVEAECRRSSERFKFASVGVGTVKSIVDQGFRASEIDKEVEIREYGMIQNRAKQMMENARSSDDDAQQLLKSAYSFYKEYASTREEAARAAIYRF